MTRTPAEWRAPALIATSVLVVAILYLAHDVFVLIALGVLLSFLLGPLVDRLERIRIGRTASALTACFLAFAMLGLLAWVVTQQGVDLVEKLPDYKENLQRKIDTLRGKVSAAVSNATRTIVALDKKAAENRDAPTESRAKGEISDSPRPADAPSTVESPAQPTQVTVINNKDTPLSVMGGLFATLVTPLGKMAVVFFLAFFMLVERAQILERVIRLAGRTRLNLTTQALNDVADRVSRYLVMQLAVNAAYGLAVGLGLFLIGIPNAVLFGLLAAILRFMPYVGFWIAAALPLVLSFASPSWYEPLLTIALFATLEFVANYLEPMLYGFSTGLSPIAVVIAALFWTFIWGPVGLLLSTPLTVVLVVLGKYVPSLEFLAVALSDAPALEPHWRLYQRLLAADYEDAEELFEAELHERSLEGAYDGVVLPALVLAEGDYHHGRIDPVRRKLVNNSIRDFVELKQAATLERAATLSSKVPVLCVPARDEADEIAGTMLAQVLVEKDVFAQAAGVDVLAGELIETIERKEYKVVCISAVPPSGMRHARYLYKRIRSRFPEIFILIGTWTRNTTDERARKLSATMDPNLDRVVGTQAEAIECIAQWVERCALQQSAVPSAPNC